MSPYRTNAAVEPIPQRRRFRELWFVHFFAYLTISIAHGLQIGAGWPLGMLYSISASLTLAGAMYWSYRVGKEAA
ncbi:MAG TPA: hypothetical protein VM513_33265 [Kofleriaceae bacterium]|nr:hypothetical protein [Kofleriaceae bacterium]